MAPHLADLIVGRGPLPERAARTVGRVEQFADQTGITKALPTPLFAAAKALLAARQGGIVNDISSQFGGPR